ncbi:MAG: hypothetical protein A3F67_01545 [Verrucomicrobia bacterium RIFCSPHIGHO2_12_FULL_41_10]|nr:MAG: hypothetical protein A3F67_01545 [Verrucomicrobia bacterium RIFCSPHIGHO2_12_FULL_41_10]HLB33661.1 type II toxin-antitoxin system RelB/DinJ family antitoxin [Chthoniobacterales bacterium]
MSKTAILRARVNSERKKVAEEIFSTLGLSIADAIDVFFSQVCIHKSIPFPLTTRPHLDLSNATQEEIEHRYADRIPNKITQRALTEKSSMRGYKSPSEVLKALNA